MINHIVLTEYLSHNADICVEILEDLGFQNISMRSNEIRFPRIGGQNQTSMVLYKENMRYCCFSTNENGNIYSLCMKMKGWTFSQTLRYIGKKCGFDTKTLQNKVSYPFGGFFKKVKKETLQPEFSLKIYDESILEEYKDKFNLMFFRDGINFDTQAEFNVGYDSHSGRITIPEYTLNGDLCGIMGRLNDKNCNKEDRWIPIIPCHRKWTLYGYHKNYKEIQENDAVIIGESEKFVQQLHSMNCKIGLGLCGCDISSVQSKYIKGLMVKNIILALDEGIKEDEMVRQVEKLKTNNALMKNNVGYIFDRTNKFLLKGGKQSPSDIGKNGMKKLLKECVNWI